MPKNPPPPAQPTRLSTAINSSPLRKAYFPMAPGRVMRVTQDDQNNFITEDENLTKITHRNWNELQEYLTLHNIPSTNGWLAV